jgi:hypothetical protein
MAYKWKADTSSSTQSSELSFRTIGQEARARERARLLKIKQAEFAREAEIEAMKKEEARKMREKQRKEWEARVRERKEKELEEKKQLAELLEREAQEEEEAELRKTMLKEYAALKKMRDEIHELERIRESIYLEKQRLEAAKDGGKDMRDKEKHVQNKKKSEKERKIENAPQARKVRKAPAEKSARGNVERQRETATSEMINVNENARSRHGERHREPERNGMITVDEDGRNKFIKKCDDENEMDGYAYQKTSFTGNNAEAFYLEWTYRGQEFGPLINRRPVTQWTEQRMNVTNVLVLNRNRNSTVGRPRKGKKDKRKEEEKEDDNSAVGCSFVVGVPGKLESKEVFAQLKRGGKVAGDGWFIFLICFVGLT